MTRPRVHLPRDPRYLQLAVLALLLLHVQARFDYAMPLSMCLLTVVSALLTQVVCTAAFGLRRFDPRSPLISGLSLCLLLRTNDWWLAAIAAALAIGSKFVIRSGDRHIFNPTNFAIVLLLLLTDRVWLSPGQWGSGALLAAGVACAGLIVLYRAARSDVTIAYIGFFAALLLARALYLGDPLAIPLRQLQSGALLIFAFFMISDPRTIPDTRAGRVLFALLVAAIGVALQFNWYMPIRNGVFYALALSSPVVPLLNRLLPGHPYAWNSPQPKETRYVADLCPAVLSVADHR